jgi:hypothetical protein
MPVMLGLLMISFGLLINVTPRFYDPIGGIYFDLTGFNLPVGIIMVTTGAVLIWKFLKESV